MILQVNLLATNDFTRIFSYSIWFTWNLSFANDDFTKKFTCKLWFYKKIKLQIMILVANSLATYNLQENLVAIYDFTRKFSCNLWFYKKI